MNKPSKWKDVIIAWAEGKTCQNRLLPNGTWTDVAGPGHFKSPVWIESDSIEYRIKPTLKYRNYLYRYENKEEYTVGISTYPETANVLEGYPWFAGWLGDWQEIEV